VQVCRQLGTPPASGSLDQMRRMQVTARVGGECELDSLLERNFTSVASATNDAAVTAGIVAYVCWSEFDFDNGCEAGPVRSCDVAQQVLLWQQAISQAFGPGVFMTKHGTAGSRTAPRKSAVATTAAVPILPTIMPLYSTIRAAGRVRWSPSLHGLIPFLALHRTGLW